MRLFYQIYVDGMFFEIFEISPFYANTGQKYLYGAIFNYLATKGIEEFREDSKQYVFVLSGDIEVKICKFETFGRKWLQVSATTPEVAKAVFEELKRYVKSRLEEADA